MTVRQAKQVAVRDRVLAELEQLRTVDCHSHTLLKNEYYDHEGGFGLFNLMDYFARDIFATTGQRIPAEATDKERWEFLKGVLDKARNVSYWRHVMVTLQGLFGLEDDDLTDDNWAQVNDAIHEKSRDPDWYHHIIVDVCGIITQVRNVRWYQDWEPEFFTAVIRMDPALHTVRQEERQRLSQHVGVELPDLAALKTAVATLMQGYKDRGAIGIKLGHAYWRTLAVEEVSEHQAGQVYAKSLQGRELSSDEEHAFQDHMIDWLASLCRDMELIFQIHTGVQNNWAHIPYSNPLHLCPLLRKYKDVRFDLFHAGYPYSREIGMLGKHYQNVWLNLAWCYAVTMAGSRQSLSEWIDLVPGYRLLGFGSDVFAPELIYGHLLMARSCVADVLAEKVARDFLSLDAALDLARKMFYDNPMALYGLG